MLTIFSGLVNAKYIADIDTAPMYKESVVTQKRKSIVAESKTFVFAVELKSTYEQRQDTCDGPRCCITIAAIRMIHEWYSLYIYMQSTDSGGLRRQCVNIE